ncbi:hypothetical protein [Fastidiosipila sanguinis]|uniref:Uncharacterized protein n=1 Tax=Fastidiosipila sanguinis TaxID=236753 RepID=A0A2S0KM62_9FIRM|nr:hypothetical protein [Fastidiosipila sanguinis]AVM42122.1 hypothetical protein C5Q98_02240 [Fastidiosipila sanguinis]
MTKSIYQKIIENLDSEGKLTQPFSVYDIEAGLDPFVYDGAFDSVLFLHERRIRILVKRLNVYKEIWKMFKSGKKTSIDLAWKSLEQALAEDGTSKVLEVLLIDLKDLQQEDFYPLFLEKVKTALKESRNVELIKFCLGVLELEDELDDEVKAVIFTLALADEFTFYASLVISNWENSDEVLFNLIKKVSAWGRIMTLPKINLKNIEVNQWLYEKGWQNFAKPEYQASIILANSELTNLLNLSNLNEENYEFLTRMLYYSSVIEPGVVRIYNTSLDKQIEILKAWLNAFNEYELNYLSIIVFMQLYNSYRNLKLMFESMNQEDFMHEDEEKLKVDFTFLEIFMEEEKFDDLLDYFEESYNFELFKSYIDELGDRENVLFALQLGTLEFGPYLEDAIQSDPVSYLEVLKIYAIQGHPDLTKVLDVYRDIIDLVSIAVGPKTPRFSLQMSDNEKLMTGVLAEIKYSPRIGSDFIIAGLQSSHESVRLSAVNTLRKWLKFSEFKLDDIDEGLEDLIYLVLDYEDFPNIRNLYREIVDEYGN